MIKILGLHIHCNGRKVYLMNPFVVKAVKCCLPVCNTEIGVDKGKVYIRLNELSSITTCPIMIIFPINGSLISMSQTKVLLLIRHIQAI